MTRVKICGITSLEDARLAVKAGADALGFIFVENTPRFVTPERVATIVRRLPPFVTPVGVFWVMTQVGLWPKSQSRWRGTRGTGMRPCARCTLSFHCGVTLFPNAGLAGFTPYFVPLYLLNTVDPSRLVTGGSGANAVQELTNAATATGAGDANWVAVPLGAGFNNVNQNRDAPIVYGG